MLAVLDCPGAGEDVLIAVLRGLLTRGVRRVGSHARRHLAFGARTGNEPAGHH
jgi:hypothetical protein